MAVSICYLGRLNVKIGSMQDDELKSLIFLIQIKFLWCYITFMPWTKDLR